MKNFTLGLVFVFTGAVALTGACGGDDESSGGSGGSGGAGKGGSTSSGGTGGKSSSGGTGNNTGSGGDATGSAGDSTSGGGSTASGGAPGDFDNPAGCPTSQPEDATDCYVDTGFQDSCLYPGARCDCFGYDPGQGGAGGGQGDPGSWSCEGGGEDCPTTQPEGECSGGLYCPYPPDVQCWCGNNDEWFCLDPFDGGGQGGQGNVPVCPEPEPDNGAPCGDYGVGNPPCEYEATTCFCFPENWGAQDPELNWACF